MAKRAAKKIGGPNGSKNGSFLTRFKKLAFDAQAEIIARLSQANESAKQSRAADLMAQLQALGAVPKKRGRPAKSANGTAKRKAHALKGKSLQPKYRSKKDPSRTWAGRGQTPLWMREEMKAGKLSKENFAI